MKAFDYLSSLLLLFTAITLGELTMGVAYSLNSATRATFYLPHTLFILATFFGSVEYALRIYSLRKVQEWQFWSLVLVLLPGMVWLLGTKLLFPDVDPPMRYEFQEVFQSNKVLIYSMCCAYILIANFAMAMVFTIKHYMRLIPFGILVIVFVFGIFLDSELLDYPIAFATLFGTILLGFWKRSRLKNSAS